MQQYKRVFDEIEDALIITNGISGEIIEINKSVSTLLGYEKSDLIGKHFNVLFEDRAPLSNELKPNEINIFGSVLPEKQIKNKYGITLPFDMTINTFEEEGQTYVLTSLRNVTERIAFQNRIKIMNQELIQLNASKDKLFSIIAHDLRNPLMALMGFSELMIEDSRTLTAPEVERMSQTINKLSKDTYDLLENLLSWARVQTNSFEIEKVKFDLYREVETVFSFIAPSAALKNVTLRNKVPLGIEVYGDRNMINTILRNLVSNAVKFTPEYNKVFVHFDSDEHNSMIIVSDEGIGMEQNYIDDLFRIDKQTSRLGTNGEKGTGLGLVLCGEFIKLHGGAIKVISELNHGTTFIIELPKKK